MTTVAIYGETSLTVQGPVSGKTYSFPSPGTGPEIEGRDDFGFDTVPLLERLRS